MAVSIKDTVVSEKDGPVHLEDVKTAESAGSHERRMLNEEDTRKVALRAKRKVDWRLVPVLGASTANRDRSQISAARIAGLDVELGINQGNRYSVVVLVFFITYFLFEVPSNIVLRKVGASNWLSFLCFSWGVVILGAGFSRHWTDVVVCRLLLGLFEAGFFPGSVYLISCWYTRYEIQKRLAVFYSINILAVGFGSILAYGIMQLNGKGGYLAWRWIFIINGLMTIFLAIVAKIGIIDFPDKIHLSRRPYLTPAEVQAIQDKLERDRQDAEYDPLTMAKAMDALGRWQLWLYSIQFMCITSIVYCLAFFIPIIIAGMGYDTGTTFLMSAPPAVAAVPWVMFVSWAADRYKCRAPWIVAQALACVIGILIVGYVRQSNIRFFGLMMATGAANGNIPTAIAWQANNIRGQSLRMVASGLQVGFGAIGGIYASTVMMEREAPLYRTGLWAVCGTQFFLVLSTVFLCVFCWHKNKKADKGDVVIEEMDGFRYTY
ncbi:major facilitator superfamily domain-containing protein [Microdochium trichocladiopsis]|uniref:Major facilitator superfamily domain-containing protein n=1 Tax=Microdochium trichocladiopsis TaxID=1682393 RepID=A0A9P9BSH0_9PEZI|nr:major facilitator superfamily domain-containing protein [Microdochium trichocladiopsis]KAH7034785.1 major facilitator superfamily domain-containing protein [Microdochium trichocladiopsis]